MPIGKNEIRNRFGYHRGNAQTIPQHEQFREIFKAFAEYLDELLPDGRPKSVCFTKLQEASMWGNFAIAEQAPLVEDPNESFDEFSLGQPKHQAP